MRRLLTLLMLMILAAVGLRTQQPSPYLTGPSLNGLAWREAPDQAKVFFVNGAMFGYTAGACTVLWHLNKDCGVDASLPAWFHSKTTVRDTVKGMDSFYQDGAHISLAIIDAYIYSQMKLSGSTKQELDSYLNTGR